MRCMAVNGHQSIDTGDAGKGENINEWKKVVNSELGAHPMSSLSLEHYTVLVKGKGQRNR